MGNSTPSLVFKSFSSIQELSGTPELNHGRSRNFPPFTYLNDRSINTQGDVFRHCFPGPHRGEPAGRPLSKFETTNSHGPICLSICGNLCSHVGELRSRARDHKPGLSAERGAPKRAIMVLGELRSLDSSHVIIMVLEGHRVFSGQVLPS